MQEAVLPPGDRWDGGALDGGGGGESRPGQRGPRRGGQVGQAGELGQRRRRRPPPGGLGLGLSRLLRGHRLDLNRTFLAFALAPVLGPAPPPVRLSDAVVGEAPSKVGLTALSVQVKAQQLRLEVVGRAKAQLLEECRVLRGVGAHGPNPVCASGPSRGPAVPPVQVVRQAPHLGVRPGGAPPDRQILPGGRADVHFLPPSSGMPRRRNRRGGEEGGPAATAADGSALDVDSPRVRRRRQEVDDDARED